MEPETLLLHVLDAALAEAEAAPRDAEGNLTPEGQAQVDAVLALADDPEGLAELAGGE